MIILTEFYVPSDEERYLELLYCFAKNLANKDISEIYFFAHKYDIDQVMAIENIKQYEHKVCLVECATRPTFRRMFKFASENIKLDENIIICNSDIYFDETLSLLKDIDMTNKFYVLNRYDFIQEGDEKKIVLYDVPYSQDAWIFKKGLMLKDADFNLGIPGCDNKIALLALLNGNMIYNPSKVVKSYHVHKNKSRNYSGVIPGPYLLSWPNNDVNIVSEMRIISSFK